MLGPPYSYFDFCVFHAVSHGSGGRNELIRDHKATKKRKATRRAKKILLAHCSNPPRARVSASVLPCVTFRREAAQVSQRTNHTKKSTLEATNSQPTSIRADYPLGSGLLTERHTVTSSVTDRSTSARQAQRQLGHLRRRGGVLERVPRLAGQLVELVAAVSSQLARR